MNLCLCLILSLNFFSRVRGWDPRLYPYDPRIHVLGNHGILGKLHANMAPCITKAIDKIAYDGYDVRDNVKKYINAKYGILDSILLKKNHYPSVLDICCGAGLSTPKFHNCMGIDTSHEMISVAQRLNENNLQELIPSFMVMNAEDNHDYFKKKCIEFDVCTCFFGFHEMPRFARRKILDHQESNIKSCMIVVDICPEYVPSESMLMGEPYVKDYLKYVREDLRDYTELVLIPGHVHMWHKELDNK